MRGLSNREHVLLILAMVVAVTIAFLLFRLRPRRQELERLTFATQQAEQRYESTRWPAAGSDPEPLREALREQKERISEQEAALRRHEAGFSSRGTPGAGGDLRLEVSRLADRCGVRVLEDVICSRPKLAAILGDGVRETGNWSARLVRFLSLGEPYELPARRLVLDASFAGLRSFLRGLSELSGRVVVLNFEIERNEDAAAGTPPLRARLLLVS
jgi:hypothetical protein